MTPLSLPPIKSLLFTSLMASCKGPDSYAWCTKRQKPDLWASSGCYIQSRIEFTFFWLIVKS